MESRLLWDPDAVPVGLHVALGDPEQASASVRDVGVTLRAPALESDAAPPALRGLLARWPASARDFVLRDGVASVSLALEGAPPRIEAGDVRQMIDRLGDVLETLGPARGPYR